MSYEKLGPQMTYKTVKVNIGGTEVATIIESKKARAKRELGESL